MTPKRQKLLDSILACVAQSGWTPQSFAQGAKKAGLSPAAADKLFPGGIDDIVDAFHTMIDEAMQARIKGKRNFDSLRVRDKVTLAVRARLEAIDKYREPMRRLLVRSLLPRHIRASAQALWQAADTIWVAAGDTSTDYNYYTKRLLLIAVMKSTLSFWLNDETPDRRETWAFLDRRIADVMMLGKGIGVMKTVGVSDIVSFARSRFAA